MDAAAATQEFSRLMQRTDRMRREPALDRAILLVAAVFDGDAVVDDGLAELDAIAADARRIAAGATDSYALAGAVCRSLFIERGFSGDARSFEDPKNSLFSHVLARRTGIPITLSIVLMETARRLGLVLHGVGLPGHFVVRFPDDNSRLYIDAFDRGRILDVPDCVRLVERQSKGRITWTDDFLAPVSPRAIVKRVLVNLKNALSQTKAYSAALTAIELQLILDPGDPTELRDRGILFARLQRYDRAIADLEAYLERSPDATDRKQIRDTVLRYLREARNL